MPETFALTIPTVDGDLTRSLDVGDTLFVLGANGTGKSSLVSRFFNAHHQHAKRISAHRQTWFTSNTLDMTPRSRDDLERNIRSHDQQVHARYRQDYAAERTGLAIYDLIDADTMLARAIADLVRSGEIEGAQEKATNPAPLHVINELMRLSNIPIEISLEERQKIVARRNGGAPYSVAELSDGERNAFLIAADVLTAASQSLILLDEPERHLHRAIISPLLSLLFQKRSDCAFIVSTHELMLPVDNPTAHTLLVRSCTYNGSSPQSWIADFLEPNAPIDSELKRDILGARQKIIFVEGASQSLDAPLYSLIFPQISIIPKSSCRDVEHAVRGLREAEEMHWVHAWGIVDNDRRSSEDVARLRALGVHALSHFSVEALYYHPEMIQRITIRQSAVTGEDPDALFDRSFAGAVEAAGANKDHLVQNAVERLVRRQIFDHLPTKDAIRGNPSVEIRIDVDVLRAAENDAFDQLIGEKDLAGLLHRYPLRESAALTRVAEGTGLTRPKYEAAVRKLLQEDQVALTLMRNLFDGLYEEVMQ